MKRLLLILIVLSGSLPVLAQNNILTVEAFFDTDPGIGQAVSVPFTAGTTVNEIITMGSDSLAPGFHILGLRVMSESGFIQFDTIPLSIGANRLWGITEYRSFFVTNSDHSVIEDITASEYFIDTDPGSGNGTAFTALAAGPTVNFNDIVNSNALPKGFHTVGVRVRDARGVWSIPEYKSFYISGSGSLVIQKIDTVEYFFDSDPGSGNGTIITVTAADSISLNTILTSNVLPSGFHVAGIRVKDEGGSWSVPEFRSFYISKSGSLTLNQIDTVEYFIDNDPGSGNGSIITVAAADSINLNTILASNALPSGFHVAGIRVKDDGGIWSVPEFRSFYIARSGALTIEQIDTVEYFVDIDPGTGSGHMITVTAADSIDLNTILSADTLQIGFHIAGIRVKDNSGVWSVPEYRPFFVNSTGGITIQKIDTIEYFVDTDPGVSLGTIISVSAADSINQNITITTDTLSSGFHVAGVRVRDETGAWSLEEYRAFFVSSSNSMVIDKIDTVEYFVDADPGTGNGVLITVTAADSINLNTSVTSDTLSFGFHNVGIRVKDESGGWSLPEIRSFYVSTNDQATFSPITKLEYFYDNDPGFGLGNQIPSSGDSIQVNFNAAPPGIAGLHQLTVRVQTADGTWSIGETKKFYSLNPGRQLDSLALVELYNKNNGPNWTLRFQWLSSNLDFWYGVHMAAGRVDSLYLHNNNLTGVLPKEFAYISNLRTFDLSNNTLADSIPFNLPNLMSTLQYADVSSNQLNGLPDMSIIPAIQVVKATNNRFDFGDLEPNAGIGTFTYTQQAPVTLPLDSVITVNQLMSIGLVMQGFSNSYQWFKDSTSIGGANTDTYIIPSVAAADSGSYYCLITNSLLPALTLTTQFYHLRFSSLTNDSLALVSLYNNTAGPSWTNHTNWLTGNLSSWNGITLINGNVHRVSLPGNNLTGSIPDDIFYLDSVAVMDLSGNNLTGYLPGTIVNMARLRNLNLASNAIDSLPSLNLAPLLDTLNVANNKLEFNHIEANLSIPKFTYAPQDSAGAGGFVLVDVGSNYTFIAGVGGANNLYQWYKNGTVISPGGTNPTLPRVNVAFSMEGFYNVRVTNSIVPGLTIFTKLTEFGVSSLQRDSIALVKLYESTNGDNWTNKTGWDASNRGLLSTWTGVVITTNRIAQVNLPANNLDGAITDKIRDITQLQILNVHGNKLRTIPFLGPMTNLTSVDVSNNQLGFEYLEPNKNVTGFVYNPQDSLEGNLPDTIPVGSNYFFRAFTRSANNTYTWFLGTTPVSGATDSTYTLTSIQRNTMGSYYAQISNSVITDMDLYTKSARLLANASISGTVTDNVAAPVTPGKVRLFKIKPTGGFDTTNIANINAGGNYSIANVILDDYILVADPDNTTFPDLIPTYFGNTIYWEEADTIPLTSNINLIPIQVISKPAPPVGTGSIFGLVEEDLPGGRLDTRRGVARSSVSVTRTAGGNRNSHEVFHYRMGAEELAAATETDNTGQFSMPDLDPGFYRLNVQYPGIPMDPLSNLVLEVTAAGLRTEQIQAQNIEVSALVTPTKIVVTDITKPTGLETQLARNYNIYPVPTRDVLIIESKEYRPVAGKLSIVDMTGREMIGHPMELQQKTELDVHEYQPGVYILRIVPDKKGDPLEIARIVISR